MVDIETDCYYKDDEDNVIGVQVIIYDGQGNVETIVLTNPQEISELKQKVNHLDERFIDKDELESILKNTAQGTDINASKLNNFTSDQFLKVADKDSYSYKPKFHASTNKDEYGAGTATEYGHTKIIDDLTHERPGVPGEALSAHQGYELNKRIKGLENNDEVQSHQLHSHFNLHKRNGIVSLTINDWDVTSWWSGASGWLNVFTVPDAYKPAIPAAGNVKNIYFGNIFDWGNNVRMRVNCESGVIQVRVDRLPGHNFDSHITWIARE